MKPFRKLLVPTDFSTLSADALPLAADLSRRYEASVSLLHVCEHELFSVPESSHGRPGISHALLGSVAERVTRTAPCAVLTVRSPDTSAAKSPSADHANI